MSSESIQSSDNKIVIYITKGDENYKNELLKFTDGTSVKISEIKFLVNADIQKWKLTLNYVLPPILVGSAIGVVENKYGYFYCIAISVFNLALCMLNGKNETPYFYKVRNSLDHSELVKEEMNKYIDREHFKNIFHTSNNFKIFFFSFGVVVVIGVYSFIFNLYKL